MKEEFRILFYFFRSTLELLQLFINAENFIHTAVVVIVVVVVVVIRILIQQFRLDIIKH